MAKPKIATWDELMTMPDGYVDTPKGKIHVRGIPETERKAASQAATTEPFNKSTHQREKIVDDEELGYRLIAAGWLEPPLPETWEEKKAQLGGLGWLVLQEIGNKINELSAVQREDIDEAKND